MNQEFIAQVGQGLAQLRQRKPLIHHITNYVTVNDCANSVLAIGASPIMADDLDEVADITGIASALVLNIGTLNARTVQSMLAAGKAANARRIPVVLDPVGAGASALRNQTTRQLLEEVKITILRGNISEIRFVAGLKASTKGVDASEADLNDTEDDQAIATAVAKNFNCVTAITGVTDILSDGRRTLLIKNGSKLLSQVTGTGCMCTSLVGAFCGAGNEPLIAAAGGVLTMGVVGELAAETVGLQGTGSFRTALLDEISRLTPETLSKRAKIHEA